MNKQSSGLFAFVTGIAMGAAAVFLSKKDNRDLAKKKLEETTKAAKKLKQDFDKNPGKVKEDALKKGKQIANTVADKVKKETKAE